MRFSSRRMVKRAIAVRLQKVKHQVDVAASLVNMSAATTVNIVAVGLDNPLIANPTNVSARSRIKAFYFELNVESQVVGAVPQYFHWCWQYNPQGALSSVNPISIGASASKNYVFKSGVIPVSSSVKNGKVYGVIKIPSKYQRFMNVDVLQFNIISQNNNGNTDGYTLKVIYKEIRG